MQQALMSVIETFKVHMLDDFIEEIRHSPSPSGKVDHVTLEEDASIEERIKFSITN